MDRASFKRHDARPPIAFAAAAALMLALGLSICTLVLRSEPVMASIPRVAAAPAVTAPGQIGASWYQTVPFFGPALSRATAAKQAAIPTGPASPFILHASSEAERARAVRCLTDAIYYEAALEPEAGQRAVAQVVLNRVRDPNFPKSVCGVVFQGWNQPPGCQFSFTCDGSLARAPIASIWQRARGYAEQALNGYVMAGVGSATHYHANYVSPWWRATVVKIAQVGAHIFYRWPGSAGLPGALTGRYAGGEFRISDAVLTGRALPPKPAASSVAQLPGAAPVEKIVVADASAPGGQTTRVHSVIMLPGARPTPTPAQVAQINAALERKFPTLPTPPAATAPAQSQPVAKSAPKPTLEHVQLEPAMAKAQGATAAKPDVAASVQAGAAS